MLKKLLQQYADTLAYLLFGVLTTAVNYLVYIPCHNALGLSATLSNAIAWVAAVSFAFLTNKPFVFKSHDWSLKVVFHELTKFLGCRVGSGALETAILWLTVDQLALNGNWMKLLTSVFVMVANYFGSKLLVFRKK